MNPIFRSLFYLALFSLLYACTSPDAYRSRTADDDAKDSISLVYHTQKEDRKIAAFIEKLHTEQGFNGNVLIAKKGKIIFQKAIGWANYLNRDSLTINSVFELASVSKPLTATAVLMLVEDGKLRLDQQVTEFYPDFPYAGITVKMLLTHQSGLMNYIYFVDRIWPNKNKGITNDEVMKLLVRYKPASYSKPNQRFHYNNSNYMILAGIVEKVTGKTFAEFMKTQVFEPVGMKQTAVYSTAVYDKIPIDVMGHDRTWRYSVVQNFLDGPVGDKGIYSTVHDLYLFDRALRKGKLLKQQTLDSAYAPHIGLQKNHFSYGYGWRLFQDHNQQVVYHTGWWHGFRNLFVRDLKNDITIVFLTNLANSSLRNLDELYRLIGMPVIRKGAYSKDELGVKALNQED